jgi:hypothetical protein
MPWIRHASRLGHRLYTRASQIKRRRCARVYTTFFFVFKKKEEGAFFRPSAAIWFLDPHQKELEIDRAQAFEKEIPISK